MQEKGYASIRYKNFQRSLARRERVDINKSKRK